MQCGALSLQPRSVAGQDREVSAPTRRGRETDVEEGMRDDVTAGKKKKKTGRGSSRESEIRTDMNKCSHAGVWL